MPRIDWDGQNKANLKLAKRALASSGNVADACELLARQGLDVSVNGLETAFRRRGLKSPGSMCDVTIGPISPTSDATDDTGDIAQLVKCLSRSPTFERLCDSMDMSPSATRDLISRAKAAGIAVKIGHGHVGIGFDDSDEIHQAGPPPTVGGVFKVGVMSDLHLGSKYCLRREIADCANRIHRAGARDILIPGDILDGCYRHGEFELKYSGLEDQTNDFIKTLPRLDGLRYHAITGNHDYTFTEKTGVDVGAYIAGQFASKGRTDITFYGDRAATLRIGGTTVRLLHPCGSCSYAVSYKLAKFVEAFSSAEKPGVLLVGHYHRSCYIYTRGVHTIACPTLQGPGSAFGKSLGLGPQAIGGLLLSWRLTKFQTLREFNIRSINYFKHEKEKETI
jgi:predicted phosphodiesterase